ncbi:L-ornithine N5 oxygenase [Tothia fuscella]|uniref:L-ornithine N(5)-monooxygenase [NAD(P)H] n=1 Tax=Tothia fuscella TaxID=1048955 RepID=A0A9P4NIB9_9PEZI|nr:L-ornithine N5 oxygenase [Tothia fuscella]
MAPHANAPDRGNSSFANGYIHDRIDSANGLTIDANNTPQYQSHLQPTELSEIHDLICVGFGPASLAIAVALHDGLDGENGDSNMPAMGVLGPKVAFLERQPRFAWHAGMLLEGAKMQISFVKDMATLRNPRSPFTFLNYLHVKNRLIQFTNLDTFLPQRIEFEDYLQWCAGWFDDVVHYSQEVLEIKPDTNNRGHHAIDSFSVISRNTTTGEVTTRCTRHVVIAAGGKPAIPQPFPSSHPRILHSSQYAYTSPQILTDKEAHYRVAVVGGGQSAAEIFSNLHTQYPNCQTRLIIRGASLKPSDDSPFVNEIFDPCRVDPFYSQPPSARALINSEHRTTNYGVVRLELLEHIYQTLYMQRVHHPHEEDWQHRIENNSTIVGVNADSSETIQLQVARRVESCYGEKEVATETQEYDVVIIATGYTRNSHEDILAPARYLMPGGDDPEKKWTVSRDYKVHFQEGLVSEDAGVFLQGCNEESHGLADSLLSILAIRGGEIVQSVFGGEKNTSHWNSKLGLNAGGL